MESLKQQAAPEDGLPALLAHRCYGADHVHAVAPCSPPIAYFQEANRLLDKTMIIRYRAKYTERVV